MESFFNLFISFGAFLCPIPHSSPFSVGLINVMDTADVHEYK